MEENGHGGGQRGRGQPTGEKCVKEMNWGWGADDRKNGCPGKHLNLRHLRHTG